MVQRQWKSQKKLLFIFISIFAMFISIVIRFVIQTNAHKAIWRCASKLFELQSNCNLRRDCVFRLIVIILADVSCCRESCSSHELVNLIRDGKLLFWNHQTLMRCVINPPLRSENTTSRWRAFDHARVVNINGIRAIVHLN